MQLFLIRHAQSSNNALPESQRVEDPGLTEIGQQQAKLLGDFSTSLNLTHIIASPFLRTLLTAYEIQKATGIIPSIRPELHEQGGCYRGWQAGAIEGAPGMSRSEILAMYPNWKVCDSICEKGWWKSQPYESHEQARARARRLLEATSAEFGHTSYRIAYVMHADFKTRFLEQIQTQFEGQPLGVPWNTSVTEVELNPDGARIQSFNSAGHLPDNLLTC